MGFSNSRQLQRQISTGLSIRGLVILLLSTALIVGPGLSEYDVVASVLGYSLLAILFLCFLATFWNSRTLKTSLKLNLLGSNTETAERVESNTLQLICIKTSPVRLLPFLGLKIQPLFAQGNCPIPAHLILHSFPSGTVLNSQITFPHRGPWLIEIVQLRLSDRLGLASINWDMELSTAPIEVFPAAREPANWPVLSSYHRPGDTQQDVRERTGDPLDLKRYNPADGAHRIVWKLFAKTGELVSRHPESSMIPEGQAVVYCFAAAKDDIICSETVAYLRKLEALDLEICFSCCGTKVIAESAQKAEELLVQSVWAAESDSLEARQNDFLSFLSEVQSRTSVANAGPATLDRIIIFVPTTFFEGGDNGQLLTRLGQTLDQQTIAPVFFLDGVEPGPTNKARPWLESKLLPLLIEPITVTKQRQDSTLIDQFLKVCVGHNWAVIVE